MLFDGLDGYLRHMLNSVPWHINWFYSLCWSWKKNHFSSSQTILNCQAEYRLKKDISVEKFNECHIEQHGQISKLCSQNYEIESLIRLVYGMKELNWWPCPSILSKRIYDFGTFYIVEQQRLRRGCANAQTRQSLCCSHTQSLDVDDSFWLGPK